MNKNEMKNRISIALKDPILQQGFEIICKENEELKILLRQCYQYHLHPEVSEYPYDKVEKFFNKGGLC